MAVTVADLIGCVCPEIEAIVCKAYADVKDKVQKALRQESRLMRRPQGPSGKDAGQEYVVVPVEVNPGLPECLRSHQLPVDDPLDALIAPYRSTLMQAREDLVSIENLIDAVRSHSEGEGLLNGRDRHLPPIIELIEDLSRRGSGIDLAQLILSINRDVLGAYIFDGPTGSLFHAARIPRIEIYWRVIGLLVRELDVSVEDLTVVVLAHEQAHAYTHLGHDADGESWDTRSFAKSDIGLVEGLAQYYTERVVMRLEKSHPGARTAYERLLERQPPDYRTHLPWMRQSTPEAVRIAMIEERRPGVGRLQRFEDALRRGNERLSAGLFRG